MSLKVYLHIGQLANNQGRKDSFSQEQVRSDIL
jgi:hypothetical protein